MIEQEMGIVQSLDDTQNNKYLLYIQEITQCKDLSCLRWCMLFESDYDGSNIIRGMIL